MWRNPMISCDSGSSLTSVNMVTNSHCVSVCGRRIDPDARCTCVVGVGSEGQSPSVLCSASERSSGEDGGQSPQPLRDSGGVCCHGTGKRWVGGWVGGLCFSGDVCLDLNVSILSSDRVQISTRSASSPGRTGSTPSRSASTALTSPGVLSGCGSGGRGRRENPVW